MPVRQRKTSLGMFVIVFSAMIFAELSASATLIVTAICKDGVYIRSDKRNRIKRPSKPVEYHDDFKKVFVTTDKRIIIYNHGINRIKRISWREHAVTLATKLQHSTPADINAALGLIEATLASDVAAELTRNKLDDFCAFVVVMKMADGRYRAGEISWRKGQLVRKQALNRFISSGSGKKYLHPTKEQENNDHWANLTVKQAKCEVTKLYDAAAKRQTEAKGTDFSSSYDELIVVE